MHNNQLKFTTLFLFIFSFLFAVQVSAHICNATYDSPCLVLDTHDNPIKLENWRTAKMLAKAYGGNVKGQKDLKIAGSATTSSNGFLSIIKNISKEEGEETRNIIDIDLRQELHGFLNGDAINLATEHNWMMVGKSYDEIMSLQKIWLNKLASEETIDNVLNHQQFKAKQFNEGVNIPVKSIQDEEEIVHGLGIQYERLTVTDHRSPDDENINKFVSIVRHLPKDTWIYVHCRGGDGRTTTFFAMFDMLHNADKVPFKDIIKRQASVEPYYDLSKIDRKDKSMRKYYIERYELLKQFYEFSKAYIKDNDITWTSWKNNNK